MPAVLPRFLPDDWKGAFVLLVMVFVLSSFLDNIAAAIIGGTMAATVFRGKVHIGYLAAIVAASNAGGSGSVVGDTTTTMMWIDGVSPLEVLDAYVAAARGAGRSSAFRRRCSSTATRRSSRTRRPGCASTGRASAIVAIILAAAIAANVLDQPPRSRHGSDRFPFIGAAVWVAILACAPWRKPDWTLLPEAFKGSIFLLSLVLCASMMPVEKLPAASWQTAFGLGFVSAVFDNIPLTALALKQGGYDWGFLAYAVGFGGSMIWFGSSAGRRALEHVSRRRSRWAPGCATAGTSPSPTSSASSSCSRSSAGTRTSAHKQRRTPAAACRPAGQPPVSHREVALRAARGGG